MVPELEQKGKFWKKIWNCKKKTKVPFTSLPPVTVAVVVAAVVAVVVAK